MIISLETELKNSYKFTNVNFREPIDRITESKNEALLQSLNNKYNHQHK